MATQETVYGTTTSLTEWGGGGATSAWNAMATERDGFPVGGNEGVVARNGGAASYEASRDNEEPGGDTATGKPELGGGGGTTESCNTAVAGRDAAAGWDTAPAGCLAGVEARDSRASTDKAGTEQQLLG